MNLPTFMEQQYHIYQNIHFGLLFSDASNFFLAMVRYKPKFDEQILMLVVITPRSLPKLYNYWIHLALEVTLAIFYLTTFSLLASEIPLWDAFDSKFWTGDLDKTLVSAARASKAAVALSIVQFLTLLGSMGFIAYTIYIYRANSTSTSAHARQINNRCLSHHYRTSPSNHSPTTVNPFSRLETPSSPRPVFSHQDRPISLPVLQERPEIGGTYRMRETYERNAPMQSHYRGGEVRMEVHGHGEGAKIDRSEEDDERRTDFSPAFV
ncbi:hypothetical protein SBOR_6718 [Sclerotinia borealis F-4128]|uniref:Uncharacterized protein n=1 Tax=Sclerotinia borealis (strain F-4128) TaxID=1432307 RepID=W9CED1_SCLBF|nr:hypothetical protein SBOR_6718 [Sclerotinia borealis F-4128]